MSTSTLQPENPSRTAMIAGVLVVIAVIVGGLVVMRRGGGKVGRATAPARGGVISGRGDVAQCALSPGGSHIAYTLTGQGAIRVRQIASGTDVQILAPQRNAPHDLRFTPDGSFIYYLADDPDRTGFQALYSIPSLGGAPVKRADDVDSRITFSPDGNRICFIRRLAPERRDDLVILDLKSNVERVLANASAPVSFLPAAPDWSPDGARVAAVEARSGEAYGSSLVTFRVDDGQREVVGAEAWGEISDLSWLPGGAGLVISAFDRSSGASHQLWTITYSEGRFTRIPTDPGFYSDLNLSADGTTLAALRYQQGINLWTAAATGDRDVRQITLAGEEAAISSMDTADSSSVYFEVQSKGSTGIWTIREDGANQKPVTSGPDRAFSPTFRSGAGLFYVQEDSGFTTHIWRSDANGERPQVVTSGGGERLVDISPDGRTVLFQRDERPDTLWSVPSDGGEPTRLGPSTGNYGFFSPDGRRIFHILVRHVGGDIAVTPEIISAKDGERVVTAALSPTYLEPAWTPDGKWITYLVDSNGRRNLFRLRLAGGGPERITRFEDGRIEQYHWSPDGKHIVFHRSVDNAQNLWVTDADGSHPVAITDFKAGNITGVKWTRDSSRVILMRGESSQNVALLRNFK